MQTVIFDLDGTLADTSGDLIAAANHCFRAMGAGNVLDAQADAGTALRGGRAMLRLGLGRIRENVDEGEVDRWYQPLLKAYGEAIDNHTVFYPGAMEAVWRLRSAGVAVGICTNKPEGLARQLLTSLGVIGDFDSLVGADTLPVRKPDPTPLAHAVAAAGGGLSASVLIGDSVTDRDTARAAGVPCVLVTFSPAGHSVSDLTPDALLHDYADFEDTVLPLIAG